MALVLNLYRDGICKEIGLQCGIGVSGITGTLANKSAWIAMSSYGIYFKRGGIATAGGVILSGATPIFNLASINDLEILSDPSKALISDKVSNGSGNYIYNAFFAGIASTSGTTMTGNLIQFFGSQSPGSTYPSGGIRFRRYAQTPAEAEMQQRATWNYLDTGGYEFWTQMQGALERCIMVYKLNIWETDYYMFAIGLAAGGDLNNNMTLVLIPVEHFEDKEVKPYVGPVSKDSAAAFTPTTPRRDSIASRDLTGKKDPYGFNTGNGTKLIVINAATQADIVKQLYTGFSGDDLNALSQVVSGVIGGNSHRKAEELQTMVSCILCSHIVPVITTGYAGTATTLYTLGGYQLYNPAKAVNAVVSQIVEYTTASVLVSPVVNNFLSFAPYAHVSLSVPFVGDIPVEPSALFGSSVYFRFAIDLYTGTFSVDVHLVDSDGRDYIYATRQTNCAVDIPVMGTGANGNPLQKIASAAGNVASGGIAAAPQAVYNIASAATDAKHSTVIGRAGSSNIAPYLSCRHCYLVITYPESSNADDFFARHGGVAHISGTVGSFAGTGYTEFEAVDVSGISGATDAEKREIERILKGGCYV